MNKELNRDSGFVTAIVLIIIALVALKYLYNFDIVTYIKSPQSQSILSRAIKYFEIFRTWLKTTYDWADKNIIGLLKK